MAMHILGEGISKSGLSSSRFLSKVASKKYKDFPIGYRPVRVDWKDLDKCSVCHMDEEYENNLFLQCDKCRMMVHARCYGELEPVDGVIWLCNLCRPGSPDCPPPCCLCPVIGGAMKPTTDGRWAHLACAIWIPETCLSDIKKMEPIDGLNRINKLIPPSTSATLELEGHQLDFLVFWVVFADLDEHSANCLHLKSWNLPSSSLFGFLVLLAVLGFLQLSFLEIELLLLRVAHELE
ncbi:histone-lysine N-methyltransferase ATX2-like isoform X2 [Cucumis melo var. makuwa]|uniref:Histone-lysine N-methyltransferase ATX2-like isoform X2 n=1 Tax=Cucumis melo var. makuwa TaxID=1194695 RepID=A0A5D3DKU6_CUCMM|nr:histone-lysine N-methyltransferase ATX2-like isoform X2 [Cucumis melo var. makuwa]